MATFAIIALLHQSMPMKPLKRGSSRLSSRIAADAKAPLGCGNVVGERQVAVHRAAGCGEDVMTYKIFSPSFQAVIAVAAMLATPVFASSAGAGDPVRGKAVFGQCSVCHKVVPTKNLAGPSLFGIVGRKAGTVPGFSYSSAMMAYGKPWTAENLDAFIGNPRKVVPSTKMIALGISDPKKRADVIAYLSGLK